MADPAVPAVLFVVHLQKMAYQTEYVFGPLPQRRNRNREGIQPVKKIQPEPAVRSKAVQVPVRCGHKGAVHGFVPGAAHRSQFFVVQVFENLGLDRKGHFPDFVQKKSAACGKFDQPRLSTLRRPCERPLFITEQLRLQKILRECRTVDLDKRLFSSVAVFMDEFGQKPFAGTGFALDENIRNSCPGQFAGHLERAAHGIALGHDIALPEFKETQLGEFLLDPVGFLADLFQFFFHAVQKADIAFVHHHVRKLPLFVKHWCAGDQKVISGPGHVLNNAHLPAGFNHLLGDRPVDVSLLDKGPHIPPHHPVGAETVEPLCGPIEFKDHPVFITDHQPVGRQVEHRFKQGRISLSFTLVHARSVRQTWSCRSGHP